MVCNGGVAQLGERLLCKQEVIGSIPFTSTTIDAVGRRECGAEMTVLDRVRQRFAGVMSRSCRFVL